MSYYAPTAAGGFSDIRVRNIIRQRYQRDRYILANYLIPRWPALPRWLHRQLAVFLRSTPNHCWGWIATSCTQVYFRCTAEEKNGKPNQEVRSQDTVEYTERAQGAKAFGANHTGRYGGFISKIYPEPAVKRSERVPTAVPSGSNAGKIQKTRRSSY